MNITRCYLWSHNKPFKFLPDGANKSLEVIQQTPVSEHHRFISFICLWVKKTTTEHFLSKPVLTELTKTMLMNSLLSKPSFISTERVCDSPSISSTFFLQESSEIIRFDFHVSFCGDFKLTLQLKWFRIGHPVMYHCSVKM